MPGNKSGGFPCTVKLLCDTSSNTRLQAVAVKSVPTKPIEGQKTGTSGLRKKTAVFTGEHYLANWCCSPRCSTTHAV